MIEIALSLGFWLVALAIAASLGVIFFCLSWLVVEVLSAGGIDWD